MPPKLLSASILLCLLIAPSAQSQEPAADRAKPPLLDGAALERSLATLQLQMKIQVLQTYYGRGGFYIPPTWPQRINEEYQELTAGLAKASSLKGVDVDEWLTEIRKQRENEVLAFFETIQENIPKIVKPFLTADNAIKVGTEVTDYRKFMHQLDQWQRDRKHKLVETARFVEDTLRPIAMQEAGQADGAFEVLWRRSIRKVFRGAVKDTDDLVTAVTAYDKKRQDLESHLVILKTFEAGLDAVKIVKDPIGKIVETAQEKSLEKVQDYFKEHRPDLDPDDLKTIWEKRKKELESAWELRGKLKELDEDPTLRGNENARAIARRYAVLGAIYNLTIAKLKDSGALKALGPVGDFLEFYGEALNLIPELAKRLQATVNQVDQDFRNVRGLDQWNVTGLPPAELRQLTTFDAFALKIATDASIDSMTSPNARFYMLVDKEIIPRGWATLSSDEFTRMTETLAYERFIHAPGEASRGITDWVSENMWEWKTTKPLSGVVSDAYLTDLKKKSHESKLKPKDLLDLAHNQSVEYQGKSWTVEKFRQEADRTLDARAEEMTVRMALPTYRDEFLTEWRQFKELLRQHGVALTPQQILKLFTFHRGSGANADRLATYLRALGKQRAAAARGTVEAGVPVVGSTKRAEPITPGSTVTFTAQVIASHLPAGRQVKGEVRWTLPKGLPAPPPTPVMLKNDLQKVTVTVEVPKTVKDAKLAATVTVAVPRDPDEDAVGEATEAARGAAAPKPAERQFTGSGLFGVEPVGPLEIVARRGGLDRTEIVVTSLTLGALDPKQKYEGVAFRVQRALSPSGPWTDASKYVISVFPYAAEYSIDKKVRPDPSTYVITDSPQNAWVTGEVPYQPLCYRVVQQRSTRNPTQPMGKDITIRGQEEFSNVVSPGNAAIEMYTLRPGEPMPKWLEGSIDPARSELFVPGAQTSGDWVPVYAILCQPEQGFRHYGAHYTLKCGNGTWHWYDAPPPYPRKPNERRDSFQRMLVPLQPGPMKVTIHAEAGGASATREVNVTVDPENLAGLRRQLEEARKEKDDPRQAQERKAELERKQKAIKDLEAQVVADPATIKDSWPAFNWGVLAWNLEMARHELAGTTEYYWPTWDLRKEARCAELSCDWAGAVALRKRELDHVGKWLAARQKHYDTLGEILKKWGALNQRFKSEESEKRLQAQQKALENARAGAADDDYRTQYEKYEVLGRAAALAGNAAAHREAVEGVRQAMRKRGPSTYTPLLSMANDIVVVSGDRQAAMQAVLEARQWIIAGKPAADREREQKSYEGAYKPTWWPE